MSASPRTEAAAGTRPAALAPDAAPDARAAHVRGMFDRIAPTYDRANHLLSLSIDRYWRWRSVRLLRAQLPPGPAAVLDIACGTGDLSLALLRGLTGWPEGAAVTGADFSHAMLLGARAKSAHTPLTWLQADALRLPCRDAAFSAIASAFGFRNLTDYRAGLAEFHRALRPGGVCAILEITRPALPVLRQLYPLYFEHVLPRLGGWISGDRAAYAYLPDSVSRFPDPPTLVSWMTAAGFRRARFHRFTGGIVTLHLAVK
ncbi:MAG TPA: bifunctional demethylmenaquinone methyltransferase/2-methoxy-6-polyprenyl-1,4-benzoquinol methylase UbiE [Terriglobales bacterium]|nr:bifunctional demethylmenaquinone methyltransferase/2-methoxy-6-polyprenyl-1,4-benzoquinol methylase UbiE [Terriglobales bacterium]